MSRVCPVISEAAGEARKTTTPATSIGSPIRGDSLNDVCTRLGEG
jgi:hypothetical protein